MLLRLGVLHESPPPFTPGEKEGTPDGIRWQPREVGMRAASLHCSLVRDLVVCNGRCRGEENAMAAHNSSLEKEKPFSSYIELQTGYVECMDELEKNYFITSFSAFHFLR